MMAGSFRQLVAEGGAKPVGPYSPGLEAGGTVYVSGQGALDADGRRAADIGAQTLQAITNVRLILEAAGLVMDDIVAVQFYLLDLRNLDRADEVYSRQLSGHQPARVILGTARMPTDTPVEITVVARKPGATQDCMYLPAAYGEDRAAAERAFAEALRTRGIDDGDVFQRVDYSACGWFPGVVAIDELPDGARHAIFAAVSKRRNVSFCPATGSDGGGSVEDQTRAAIRKIAAHLLSDGFTLGEITATNVYLNTMDDFAQMNSAYVELFPGLKPTRTTVQPFKTLADESLVRISALAAR